MHRRGATLSKRLCRLVVIAHNMKIDVEAPQKDIEEGSRSLPARGGEHEQPLKIRALRAARGHDHVMPPHPHSFHHSRQATGEPKNETQFIAEDPPR
jgi:hypothetical protein